MAVRIETNTVEVLCTRIGVQVRIRAAFFYSMSVQEKEEEGEEKVREIKKHEEVNRNRSESTVVLHFKTDKQAHEVHYSVV